MIKWRKIYVELKEEIKNGKYKRGDRFLRIKDVCERFNVSKITAIRVLDELEKENLIIQKQKVGGIVKRLGEVVYLIVPERFIENKLYNIGYTTSEILKGIIEEGSKENIEIKFLSEKLFFKDIVKDRVCLILRGFIDPEIEKKLISKKNPHIIILHSYRGFENVHTIRHNVYKGAYIATEYLIKKGYKRIGFISGPLKLEGFLLRFEGYLSALRKNNLEFDINLVKETNEKEIEDIEALEKLLNLKTPPDAIFCGNDVRAIHILEYCNKKNIKIPNELAICGFDNRPETEITKPSLTTVDTNLKKIGEESIKQAIRIYEGEIKEIMDIVIEPLLIERETA